MFQLSNKTKTEIRPTKKILFIDDSINSELETMWFETQILFQKELESSQYELIFVKTFEEGIEKIRKETPDLIVSEIYLFSKKYFRGSSFESQLGFELIDVLKSDGINIPVIFYSTMNLQGGCEFALNKGAFACLTKTGDLDEYTKTVRQALGLPEIQ